MGLLIGVVGVGGVGLWAKGVMLKVWVVAVEAVRSLLLCDA